MLAIFPDCLCKLGAVVLDAVLLFPKGSKYVNDTNFETWNIQIDPILASVIPRWHRMRRILRVCYRAQRVQVPNI